MTKAAAIYNFWSSFGLSAYEENSVPTGDGAPDYPYITYELITSGDFEKAQGSVSLWYRDSKLTNINAKTQEISDTIGGRMELECEDGAIILRKVNPFAQSMGDPIDNMIKRKRLAIEYFYTTKN